MGKVLNSFQNGFPGAISRSIDDIVISMANQSGKTLAFGTPVALSEDRTGIVAFDGSTEGAGHTAADFLGVTVRNPSKTPETYGSHTGAYADGEMADILVRGNITVPMTATAAAPGDRVALMKDGGAFTTGTGDDRISLDTAHVSTPRDGDGLCEIVLNIRNVL